MIQKERISIKSLGSEANAGRKGEGDEGASFARSDGRFVLYWMQRSERERDNHALEYAVEQANALGLPLLVLFVLVSDYPEATVRHYRFMLEGLAVTAERIRRRGIGFIFSKGDPVEGVLRFSEKAALLVGDRSYLRTTRKWRKVIASRIQCPYYEVETDIVVPVETASPKEEYTAGTFRPKLHRRLFHFLAPLERRTVTRRWNPADETSDVSDIRNELSSSSYAGKKDPFIPEGGEDKAEGMLESFIESKLPYFDELRNDPAAFSDSVDSSNYTSGLSPYLHFGQISPLTIALAAMEREDVSSDGFLEELLVRRELSFNFVWYSPGYDGVQSLPNWARETLSAHEQDYRDVAYSREEFERAETADLYWNAAQRELLLTGRMHGYMRMYWGKKILEWSPSVEEAYATALYLNNRYALDGRDPNSYAGVAWCFGKHDRAWKERRIFGKVRYMNDRGLKRKFKIDEYVRRINRLE